MFRGIEEKGGVHRLLHRVVLTMAEENHPKGLKKSKILNKIIQINHKEVDFREVEVTVLEKEDLLFILGVVKRVIGHLNSQIITCKGQSKERSLD